MTYVSIGSLKRDFARHGRAASQEQAKASQVQTSVARKTLDQMKAEGAQLVDMIQKAGSVINTVA